jgi:ABC-type enterochelin transport system permease subunit
MQFLTEIKKWIGEVTEILLLLIAVAIAVEILFGGTVPFFGGVVANLTGLIDSLGENGFVGLIAMAIIFFLFYRRKTVSMEHHPHQG